MAIPIVIASVIVILVLAVGGWTTTIGTWYGDLRKPPWNPPNWVFGPAWTVILALAAWSGVSSWTNATGDRGRVLILALFGINIVLHMLWSPLFFAWKRPDWALIEVPFLWLSIAALILGVGRYSTLAVWLLLPYLLWVTFAAFLNLQIVRLNRSANVPKPEIRHPEQQDPVPEGAVMAVSVDGKHRFSKTPRLSITLTSGHGVEDDAHYGPFVRHRYLARRDPKAPNLRQVHLIPSELFETLWTWGFKVRPGDLGENIATVGLDLECLPLGTVLMLGASATLQLTGLRTPCVLIDRFKSGLKNRLQGGATDPRFRAGVMAIVTEGGEVTPGDRIRAVLPALPHLALPPL